VVYTIVSGPYIDVFGITSDAMGARGFVIPFIIKLGVVFAVVGAAR
jgi:hypothetical protein